MFFKLTTGFYVCLNKTGFIEQIELNMVILIYQLLIFVIFHHWKQITRTVLPIATIDRRRERAIKFI